MLKLESPELEAKVNAYLASGEYTSPEELLLAALEALEQSGQADGFDEGELEALCRVGLGELDRGEALDLDDVIREIDELQARAEREGYTPFSSTSPETTSSSGETLPDGNFGPRR